MNSKAQDNTIDSLSQIPAVFIEYLKTRGIVGKEATHKFLHPSLADLPTPKLLKNLPEAARLAV
jgi:hypothetical protein